MLAVRIASLSFSLAVVSVNTAWSSAYDFKISWDKSHDTISCYSGGVKGSYDRTMMKCRIECAPTL